VDRLGGYEEALAEVRRLLGAPEDKPVNLVYKRKKVSLWKFLTGKAEEGIMERTLTTGEQDILRELRFHGIWHPGQPLALMPGLWKVK
jgi:hypothetical protein